MIAKKCTVPMWRMGMPAGSCDKPAYGRRPRGKLYINRQSGHEWREDGRYSGYVPDVACIGHGGPKLIEISHKGDPCMFCKVPHDDVEPGPCPKALEKFETGKGQAV